MFTLDISQEEIPLAWKPAKKEPDFPELCVEVRV